MNAVWYDKQTDGARPWLVQLAGASGPVRCAAVRMFGEVRTGFRGDGHMELQCGPRGIIVADGVELIDPEPVGP